jgi:hypothetical protein
MSTELKIYRWGDKDSDHDFMVALTPEDAKKAWHAAINGDEPEFEPVALTQKEMDAHTFTGEDFDREISFTERLKELVDAGEPFPQYFASSNF